jgi:hypothetical protein
MIKKEDAKFYIFERLALKVCCGLSYGDEYIGENGAKSLMEKISKSFSIKTPDLKYTRKDSSFCYYRTINHSIYYNPLWGYTNPVVLHEMCHAIHISKGIGGPSHGPEFTRIWIDVISRMYDFDPKIIEDLADSKDVKYTKRTTKTYEEFRPKYG